MSSVLSEYPETLPAPMVGVVTLTERRKISTIGNIRNTRNVQRDRHGTRTVAFIFKPDQAAIFREWWTEWEQRGGGWFAANWPLPWQHTANVFRFIDPPSWQLIGGGIDGQGYWSVRATVEIRGRGMLPTLEVIYLTSTPYPIKYLEEISTNANGFKQSPTIQGLLDAAITNGTVLDITATGTIYSEMSLLPEAIGITQANVLDITATGTVYKQIDILPEAATTAGAVTAITAKNILITYTNYKPEALSISSQLTNITGTQL